jgi:2-polyprenyl-3-methyl-5-hydroxy-6-metoxy-1,4-benzoquinol methylase
MTDLVDDAGRLRTLLQGYRESRIVITFAELGIGDALSPGPRTVPEIAAAIGGNAAATGRFLQAAELLGLVVRDGEGYANSVLTTRTLTSAGSATQLRAVRREIAFYRRWSHLTEAVRTGARPQENLQDERDPNWVREFTLALYDTARIAAPAVVAAMEPLIANLVRPVSVIDVGGGHGGYSLELARRFPDLRAVVFDLPPVIEVTREIIAETGLGDRVTAHAGDFHTDPLGSGYDVALLFGVLVSEDHVAGVRLLRAVRESLNPGGIAVVRGLYAGPGGAAAMTAALFDLQLLLSTGHGAARPAGDVVSWMVAAGFEPVPPLDIALPIPERLLVGRVPFLVGG